MRESRTPPKTREQARQSVTAQNNHFAHTLKNAFFYRAERKTTKKTAPRSHSHSIARNNHRPQQNITSYHTCPSKVEARLDDVHNRPQVFLDCHRGVGIVCGDAWDLPCMVCNLGLCKLEPVCCGYHHGAIRRCNHTLFTQLGQCRQGNTRVWAVEHA